MGLGEQKFLPQMRLRLCVFSLFSPFCTHGPKFLCRALWAKRPLIPLMKEESGHIFTTERNSPNPANKLGFLHFGFINSLYLAVSNKLKEQKMKVRNKEKPLK